MAQRGEAVNAQRFFELSAAPFPLPALDGVPPPPPVAPTMSMGGAGSGFGSGVSTPAGGGSLSGGGVQLKGPYAVTDEEKTRYDAIFAQYDSDNDGFLLGAEAVNLFQMSGLDRNVRRLFHFILILGGGEIFSWIRDSDKLVTHMDLLQALRDIWTLADKGQDNRLDVQEFYVAMHLIVCASKRGLPVPPQLPQELRDSVFGATRGSFTSGASVGQGDFGAGGGSSRNGSMQSTLTSPPQEHSSSDSGDPFAGLSPAVEAEPPRLGSFTGAQSNISPAASMTPPERQGSFHGVNGGFHQPTPPGSARGSFYGASVPTPSQESHVSSQQDPSWGTQGSQPPPSTPGAGFDRTNSSSLGAASSFTGMSAESRGLMGGAVHHPAGAPHGGMMAGYGAAPQMAQPSSKPFLSDEDEIKAVRQLEQQNEEVAAALSSIEKKQNAIETLAEKLRELDHLRHELVALAMKRESVRAASAAASASSSSSSASENAAELQTKRAVEKSLHDLIESEKQTIQNLQQDLSSLESELQGAMGSNSLATTMSMSSAPRPVPQSSDFSFAAAPMTTPPSSSSSSAPATTGFDSSSFGDFGAKPPVVSVDFTTPSPANSTASSSGFDSFGDFGAKPSPAASTTTSSASNLDAFANFNF